MSALLGNGTLAAPGSAYYGAGGGGGGGSGSFSTVTASTINTELITISSIGGGATTTVDSQLSFVAGSAINMGAGVPINFAAGADPFSINFLGNDGSLVGVSSLNGGNVNALVKSVPANCTLLASAVLPQAGVGGIVPLTTGAMSTVAGGRYRVSFNVDSMSPTAGALGLSDHLSFVADTTVIGTWDLDFLSTIQSGGQPLGWSMNGVFTAAANGSVLGAYQNVTSLVSTVLTMGDSVVNLERLS